MAQLKYWDGTQYLPVDIGPSVGVDEVVIKAAEPGRREMYAKWCGMPCPDDVSQAWEIVERQLASTDDADKEG